MATSESHYPGDGDVRIHLEGKEYTLRTSLDAALTLSRQSGGIRVAIDKVMALDIDTVVAVVRAGIGRDEAKRFKNLERTIYETGVLTGEGEFVARCIEFLSNLARGGKPAPAEADDSDAKRESDDPPAGQALN